VFIFLSLSTSYGGTPQKSTKNHIFLIQIFQNKNKSNQLKHQIDFETAIKIFDDTNRITVESPQKDEIRYLAIGLIIELVYAVVYVMRNTAIRIISARRASKEERKQYYEQKK